MTQTVGQYLGNDKGPVIVQHAVSDEYRARYSETFGKDGDRHCSACGRLPAWCNCDDIDSAYEIIDEPSKRLGHKAVKP